MFEEFLAELRRPVISPQPWMKDVDLVLGTKENITEAIDECLAVEVYGCDIETTGLDQRVFEGRTVDSLVGISISASPNKAYYFPIGHKAGSEYNIPWSLVKKEFGRLFDPAQKARPVFHNISFDATFLEYNGFSPLGRDRWDDHRMWEDTMILKYLLNPREKGGRGLKALSDNLLNMKMIELDDLIPDSKQKDYSSIDPSWEPAYWYAASDALCTLRLWGVLNKTYTEAPEHSASMYALEKMCLVSVCWMHRCRVYIDREKALRSCVEGQTLWWESLLDVYEGASSILGRDVTPNYVRLMRGTLKGRNKFDPNDIGGEERMTFKIRVDEARKEAERVYPDPVGLVTKSVPVLGKVAGTEMVEFPLVYDVMSPQQLGLMFRELGVPNLQATEKSGQVVTSRDVLDEVIEEAAETFPFMKRIKNLRILSKNLSQYLIPMLEDVGRDGTLMPKFDQFSADTGRFSCKTTSEPWVTKDGGCRVPFQGIPAFGKDKDKPKFISEMRGCIKARGEGWWIVAIDYAGVELRLVSNLSGEPKWIQAFFECSECGRQFSQEMDDSDGIVKATPSYCPCGSDKIGDLHTITAVAFYGESAKDRPDWKELRGNGKGCNFALSYGGTGKAVQRTIGCTAQEGDEKYKTFTQTYKTLTTWWSSQHEFARKHGYVKTAFGRVQPLPDIKSDDFSRRSKDERKAVNGPVQGTSADVTKLAMSLIYKETKKRGWFDKLKMILTVHDEIVFEIHESVIGDAIPMLSNIMVRNKGLANQKWRVPLLVDVEVGQDWSVPYDLKDLIKGYQEKRKPTGELDADGKPIMKEVKIPVPESLARIFKSEGEEESEKEEERIPQPSRPRYDLKTLSLEGVEALARWLDLNPLGQVYYENRDVTTLFEGS